MIKKKLKISSEGSLQIPGTYFYPVSKRDFMVSVFCCWLQIFLGRNFFGNFSILWFFIIFIFFAHANGRKNGLHTFSIFSYVVLCPQSGRVFEVFPLDIHEIVEPGNEGN